MKVILNKQVAKLIRVITIVMTIFCLISSIAIAAPSSNIEPFQHELDFVFDTVSSVKATITIPQNSILQAEYFTIEVRCGDACKIDNLEIITQDAVGNPYIHFPAPPSFNEFSTGDGKIAFATSLTLYSHTELVVILRVTGAADLIRGALTGKLF